MDPITAAGISLSVASLALQAFAGCVKGMKIRIQTTLRISVDVGYQLFAEVKDMPSEYHHLRIRLKIEQERLLHWGEKVGLEQERLKNPSQLLQQNGNLIIDIMLEMQAVFRETIKIEETYDQHVPRRVPEDPPRSSGSSSTSRMLEKTLKFLVERVPQTKTRLTWAMVKKDKFKSLIDKLIGHNTYIEGLLDKAAMEQLQFMQQQTYMALLQLSSDVAESKELSSAIRITTSAPMPSLHTSSDTSEHDSSRTNFARLAEFKAQQLSLDEATVEMEPIESAKVDVVDPDEDIRSEGVYQSERIWIEWKDCDSGNEPCSDWNKTIEKRIKKLAILLSSDEKPDQFGAPNCLGYFDDNGERYGFLYRKPGDVPPE